MIEENKPQGVFKELESWVEQIAGLTKPDKIYWCNGSELENRKLLSFLTESKQIIRLNEKKYPNCFLYRTTENDVARVEDRTLMCTDREVEAGPTNRWMKKETAFLMMQGLFSRIMSGRTMYIVPYLLGPEGSVLSQVGVELTDSAYVAVNMRILTRMGDIALQELNWKKKFVKAIHSIGNLDPEKRYICHFPDERLLMSINTVYGGNAILSKKPHALRIASIIARDEGWLAEHMFLLEIANKKNGKNYYISGALPSASGNTNLAMIQPSQSFKDFTARTVGDDISWLFSGKDGEMRGINPENGFFGVAYGTGPYSNPNILESLKKNTIFTNVALNPKDNTPWWEGLSESPETLYDWTGKEWHRGGSSAAHMNSRFTTPIKQYRFKSDRYEDPDGVEISAMLFGGRRSSLLPLVYEAQTFEQGILMGAMTRAETTAAQSGAARVVRDDPMSMIAFCGYNMGDYFNHWFEFAEKIKKWPKVFNVNWFRKDENGNYIWPGFGENFRILEWMIKRVDGTVKAKESPIGFLPYVEDINLNGMDFDVERLKKLLYFDKDGWVAELIKVKEFFDKFGERFPKKLWNEFDKMNKRVLDYVPEN